MLTHKRGWNRAATLFLTAAAAGAVVAQQVQAPLAARAGADGTSSTAYQMAPADSPYRSLGGGTSPRSVSPEPALAGDGVSGIITFETPPPPTAHKADRPAGGKV